MALLAAYLVEKDGDETLEHYLDRVFSESQGTAIVPDAGDVNGFAVFLENYRAALASEDAAAQALC